MCTLSGGGLYGWNRVSPSEHATVLTGVCWCVLGQPGAAQSHEERRTETRAFRPTPSRFAALRLPVLGSGGREGIDCVSAQTTSEDRKTVRIEGNNSDSLLKKLSFDFVMNILFDRHAIF